MSKPKSRYVGDNRDPSNLCFLLQSNQLEQSEGRGEEGAGGDGGRVPLAQPDDEHPPAVLVPPLPHPDQPLPPHLVQLGRGARTHVGVVVSHLSSGL